MRYILGIFLLFLSACAANPELVLQRGYKASSATVRSTTILVDRDQISVKDAENVKTLATTAKATLDAGSVELAKCRAAQKANPALDCNVQPNIALGAGVLQQLEDYLKAHEGVKQ